MRDRITSKACTAAGQFIAPFRRPEGAFTSFGCFQYDLCRDPIDLPRSAHRDQSLTAFTAAGGHISVMAP